MDIIQQVENNSNSILVYITKPESLENHQHSKGQLSFFEGGSSHLYTAETNFFVPTHHFVWIPAHVVHRFVHLKKQDICVHTFYIPKKYTTHPLFNELGIYNTNALMVEVFKFMRDQEFEEKSEDFQFFVGFLRLIPSLVADKLNIYLPLSSHPIVQKIIDYLLVHLSESLSLEQVAQKFHMGSRTFSRLFFKEISMTYHQYLKNARIMRSIELLIENKLSINEIAYEVGYSSIASYSNAFKSLTNKRPSDYRFKFR